MVAAQAKGLSSWRVLWAHIFTPAAPQLAALAGISVSLAFGASIPIEVICDTPGVGQLAWRAALDRDLPLLVTITVLVALMTLVVNSLADIALAAWKPSTADESDARNESANNKFALAVLAVAVVASLGAGWVAQHSYAEQSREFISAPPSAQFWLGTDELGRDRFARLLYGTRVSLLLAPAAALLSTLMAGLIGGAAGYLGGRWERFVTAGVDLFLSLPWLFLLLAVRALLPLNTSPVTSVMITFLLLGCLGWAAPARIIRAGTRTLVNSDYLVQASGQRSFALAFVLASPAAQSAAHSAGAVLDFGAAVHLERGQSRPAGAGGVGAAAVLGRDVARTRELLGRAAKSLDAGARRVCWWSWSVVCSSCFGTEESAPC